VQEDGRRPAAEEAGKLLAPAKRQDTGRQSDRRNIEPQAETESTTPAAAATRAAPATQAIGSNLGPQAKRTAALWLANRLASTTTSRGPQPALRFIHHSSVDAYNDKDADDDYDIASSIARRSTESLGRQEAAASTLKASGPARRPTDSRGQPIRDAFVFEPAAAMADHDDTGRQAGDRDGTAERPPRSPQSAPPSGGADNCSLCNYLMSIREMAGEHDQAAALDDEKERRRGRRRRRHSLWLQRGRQATNDTPAAAVVGGCKQCGQPELEGGSLGPSGGASGGDTDQLLTSKPSARIRGATGDGATDSATSSGRQHGRDSRPSLVGPAAAGRRASGAPVEDQLNVAAGRLSERAAKREERHGLAYESGRGPGDRVDLLARGELLDGESKHKTADDESLAPADTSASATTTTPTETTPTTIAENATATATNSIKSGPESPPARPSVTTTPTNKRTGGSHTPACGASPLIGRLIVINTNNVSYTIRGKFGEARRFVWAPDERWRLGAPR
jgi:hypothetical protein